MCSWERNRSGLRGFTLVEVMVALVIIAIILAGVYSSIVRESVEADVEEEIVDMHTRARTAVAMISNSIIRSGFFGCSGSDKPKADVINNSGSVAAGYDRSLMGKITIAATAADWDGSSDVLNVMKNKPNGARVDYLGANVALLNDAPAAHAIYSEGTDAISLAYLMGETALAAKMAGVTSDINLVSTRFSPGDIMVITDCENYSLFQKTNCNSATVKYGTSAGCAGEPTGPFNKTTGLGAVYDTNAKVYKLNIDTFFVRADGSGVPTLYKNNISSPAVSGIENIQFQVLVDTDEDGDLSDEVWRDGFSSSQAVGVDIMPRITVGGNQYKLCRLAAIRIFVLAQSGFVGGYVNNDTYDFPNSPYYSAGNPYGSANGAGGAPRDNRYRYLASRTIFLPNRFKCTK